LSAGSDLPEESRPPKLAKLLFLLKCSFFQEVANLNSADFSFGVGRLLSRCSNIFCATCLEYGGTIATPTSELCGLLSANRNYEGPLVPPVSIFFFSPENNPSKAFKFST
jgi:hypothetical protein